MEKQLRMAGQGEPMPRNYGVPTTTKVTWFDEFIAKAWEFTKRLAKQLFIVFAGVALDHGSKAILSKTDEKARNMLQGGLNGNNETDNKNRLYGDSSTRAPSSYDRFDRYSNYDQYDRASNMPGFMN